MKNYNNDFATFQSGVSTIVAAINAKAGSNHAATAAPSAIAATVNNLNLGITPSGTITKSYTTNKTETFDVTNKASCKVTVNVPAPDRNFTATITINFTRRKRNQSYTDYIDQGNFIVTLKRVNGSCTGSINTWVDNVNANETYNNISSATVNGTLIYTLDSVSVNFAWN